MILLNKKFETFEKESRYAKNSLVITLIGTAITSLFVLLQFITGSNINDDTFFGFLTGMWAVMPLCLFVVLSGFFIGFSINYGCVKKWSKNLFSLISAQDNLTESLLETRGLVIKTLLLSITTPLLLLKNSVCISIGYLIIGLFCFYLIRRMKQSKAISYLGKYTTLELSVCVTDFKPIEKLVNTHSGVDKYLSQIRFIKEQQITELDKETLLRKVSKDFLNQVLPDIKKIVTETKVKQEEFKQLFQTGQLKQASKLKQTTFSQTDYDDNLTTIKETLDTLE